MAAALQGFICPDVDPGCSVHPVFWPTPSSDFPPPSIAQYLVPHTKCFRASDAHLEVLSEMLSCAFQEAAVYGEHIWFETNVSGDFCYVGEQNCMAKLLVSHWGSPASWQGLQMQAVLLPSRAITKAFLLGDMQESGGLPRQGLCPFYLCLLEGYVPNLCQHWCSVCNGNVMQDYCLPRGGMVIYQGETAGILHS